MTELSQKNQFSSQHQHSYGLEQSKPHVFSDDELSEIFQIDFGQIFGNPDSDRQNNYKGIQLKKSSSQGNWRMKSESSLPCSCLPALTNNLFRVVQLFFLGEFIGLLLHLLHMGKRSGANIGVYPNIPLVH